MNPGGGSGRDEPPLHIQIPDDARELDRDVLAYHREQRVWRRRARLQKLTAEACQHRSMSIPLAATT